MYDPQKLEDVVLALLGVFQFDNGRVWKRYDFDVMQRLHEQGFISDPHRRAESVQLTEEGKARAEALAQQYFSKHPS